LLSSGKYFLTSLGHIVPLHKHYLLHNSVPLGIVQTTIFRHMPGPAFEATKGGCLADPLPWHWGLASELGFPPEQPAVPSAKKCDYKSVLLWACGTLFVCACSTLWFGRVVSYDPKSSHFCECCSIADQAACIIVPDLMYGPGFPIV